MKALEFARDVKREAQKITWPTRKEVTVTTIMIVVMAMMAAIFFFLVDHVISFGIRSILGI